MTLSSSIRIPFEWPNIDVFTLGKSCLYGYDSVNHCLVVHSLIQINNLNDISIDHLYLSSSPTWPIRKLILNEDETILALLADKIVYLVYLPKPNININDHSTSKGSCLCPIVRVPPLVSSSQTITCSLIDFVWLTINHFLIVYTIPSSSECYLYKVQPLKQIGIVHLHTYSVGSCSTNKFGTPTKKISLHQPSDIIKLDVTKRKEQHSELILELIFVRLQSTESIENALFLYKSETSTFSSEYVDRIRSLLSREQSIPFITLSTSSINISDSDFERNLLQFIKILTEQYIDKQENVRKELENKRVYLVDFQQTEFNQNRNLNEKFQLIQKRFQTLTEQYQQEYSRRKRLSSHVNDLLSVIEQSTPVLSDAEIRMEKQLETYKIQINCLKNNIQRVEQFILSNQNQELFENLSMENFQNVVQTHRNHIDQIRKQIQAIQTNK
ncbi:unnamed protein product [Rotaria magnacalcarata]|uniref:Nuclear pore complex protein Nup88 n=1 Tax=Rotaria magnacalcarata TaxID=392030 RepID=A0A8S2JWG8_9BILA|nr:unnamed protein product [Rotaria magnacalcarata]